MGQQEVMDLLEKETKPLTGKEIQSKLKISRGSIMSSIARLISQNEVARVDIPLKGRRHVFKYFK